MKTLLLLFLSVLLVGCKASATNQPDQQTMRITYINSLPPEQTKILLLACITQRWCYEVIDSQMRYDQIANGGVK